MKCPKCQHDIPDDSMFCNKCGYDLNRVIGTHSEIYNEPKAYTPKFLADKILKSKSSIIGERKLVTVLFADVANYTEMSEKLDPEDIHQIMDGCFKILMDEIHRYEGTINQFTGDGVMALFGAPLALEDHTQDACRAALAIQKAIKQYSTELETKYGIKFKMRIGINSGPVIVGSIGDDLRMDYTAIGDTTNLAARMESMAKPGTILVSPETYKRVVQQFEFKPLGRTEIKGKETALDVYELVKNKVDRPRLGMERQIFSEMVGRDNDLNKLELQVNKAVNGEGSIVNVIGEAGIGKSRLIAELRNSSVMKRVTLLEGRAISIGRNLSFHPIINLLKHWAQIKEKDTSVSALNKLETAIRSICPEDSNEIFPFVATLMGMKLSGRHAERVNGIEGEALEKLIFKNMRDLLIKTTELTPLVVVIEDLHWADASSIDMLEALFRLTETRRIVFINVFRPNHPDTGDKIIKSLTENPSVYYVAISLKPLTGEMSAILIHNMLNIRGFPRATIDQIIERSGGNPFFIEEVVRSFIDEGAVVRTNGEFKVTEKVKDMVIPYIINDVLMARIDRLDEKTRDLVKVAAVIGRNFFYRILTEVARTIDGIDDRLTYLKQIELIRERQRMEELEYLFKHALAQEAAYGSILQQKRKNLHLQVAQSIEKVFDNRLHEFYGMLALHYVKGENYEKAEEYLIKAGEEALRSSASSEALNYYQEGLKLYLQANQDTSDPKKLAMFEKNIATALYNKCRWEEAVEHINNAFRYWNIPTNPNKAFTLLKSSMNIFFLLTGLYQFFKSAKHVPSPREKEMLDLWYKKGKALAFFDTARLLFHILDSFGIPIKFDIAKSSDTFSIFTGSAITFSWVGVSSAISQKLLTISKRHMDENNIHIAMSFQTYYVVFCYASRKWDLDQRVNLNTDFIDTALKKGLLYETTGLFAWLTLLKTLKGDFSGCDSMIAKMFHIGSTCNYDLATISARLFITIYYLNKGRLSEALIEAEREYFISTKNHSELLELMLLGTKAEIQIRLGYFENAKESLKQAKFILEKKEFPAPAELVAFLISQFMADLFLLKNNPNAMDKTSRNDVALLPKKAYQSGKAALKIIKKNPSYREKVYRLMGEYHWLIGKQAKALRWWNKSIKTGEAMGARHELSRTYFEVGKRLLESGSKYKTLNGITAEEYLEKARIMFEEMDLQWDLDELDKIMAAR